MSAFQSVYLQDIREKFCSFSEAEKIQLRTYLQWVLFAGLQMRGWNMSLSVLGDQVKEARMLNESEEIFLEISFWHLLEQTWGMDESVRLFLDLLYIVQLPPCPISSPPDYYRTREDKEKEKKDFSDGWLGRFLAQKEEFDRKEIEVEIKKDKQRSMTFNTIKQRCRNVFWEKYEPSEDHLAWTKDKMDQKVEIGNGFLMQKIREIQENQSYLYRASDLLHTSGFYLHFFFQEQVKLLPLIHFSKMKNYSVSGLQLSYGKNLERFPL